MAKQIINISKKGDKVMSKRVFVSADWKEPFDSHSWDKEVVDRIRKWKNGKAYGNR